MRAPRVFISYSHDSDAHCERVLALAERLRRDGIDVRLDRYESAPEEGWRRWMEKQVGEADFVLLICTEVYARRIRGEEAPGRGLGVQWEGALLTQELYEAGVQTKRLVPVILDPADAAHVPTVLRDFTRYNPSTDAGFDALYRRLTGQPEIVPKPVGPVHHRPPRDSAWQSESAASVRLYIDRLPDGGRHFVAREDELRQLDDAWADQQVNAISIVAWGGVGKSALTDRWLTAMGKDDWRGARRVYGWSFYSQGTKERLTAADQLIDHALRWFGDPDPTAGSARDRGLRLADLVCHEPTLLVLDGVEPLQHPPGPLGGRLEDPALTALIKSLARTNSGLLVLSTRETIEDVASLEDTFAPRLDLGSLVDADGAALLKVLGVRGTSKERQAASAEYKGHALALSLLGTYLAKAHGGEIRKLPEIQIEVADAVAQGGHAWRVIAAYEDWLGEREVSVLRLLGLFDRPAEPEAITALRAAPAVPNLNDGLVDLAESDWNIALANLREVGLLAPADGDDLDAHPLVHAYFGHQLEHQHPDAWRDGRGTGEEDAASVAASHLGEAVEGLRNAGTEDHLPRGLFARAAFRRVHRDRASAGADLDEAEEIAERGQMLLFLADAHLERTHLHLAHGEHDAARECLDQANALVEQSGYGRRRPDVTFLEEVMAR